VTAYCGRHYGPDSDLSRAILGLGLATLSLICKSCPLQYLSTALITRWIQQELLASFGSRIEYCLVLPDLPSNSWTRHYRGQGTSLSRSILRHTLCLCLWSIRYHCHSSTIMRQEARLATITHSQYDQPTPPTFPCFCPRPIFSFSTSRRITAADACAGIKGIAWPTQGMPSRVPYRVRSSTDLTFGFTTLYQSSYTNPSKPAPRPD
jgi:hypothetical protein